MSRGAIIAFFLATFAVINPTFACVPIDVGPLSYPAGSVAQQMVSRAASIELMRVSSREAVADLGIHEYGPAYEFEFVSVETLKGWSHGALQVFGIAADAPMALPENFWSWAWEGRTDFRPVVQFPYPADDRGYGLGGCSGVASFEVGDTHLMFRDRTGRLLAIGYEVISHGAVVQLDGPAFQRVVSNDDAWLEQVRAAIAEETRRATWFDKTFQLIFGARATSH